VARLRHAQGATGDALAMILRAETLRPEDPSYRSTEGDIRRAGGDRLAAVAAYRRGLASTAVGTSQWSQIERRLIVTLLESGATAEGVAEARRVLAIDPRDEIVLKLLSLGTGTSGGG